MFDPSLTLPDGRTALQQTIDKIDDVLHGRIAPPQSLMPIVSNNYDSYRASPYNQPASYPIATSIDLKLYKPQSEWMGRLILPALEERKAVRGAWFEVHHAPATSQNLVGKRVRLRWADDPLTAELIRAVTRDVYFSALAEYTSREKGLIQPVRLDHWQLVDPLESLAGSHPVDDLIVSLSGPVTIADAAEPILEITRQPMQITGRYRGLVQFSTRISDEEHVVIHFNAVSRAFDGARETVVLPKVVPDAGGRDPSIAPEFATSELNAEGWYIYGSPNAQGAFVVQALLPRRMLALAPQRTIAAGDAYRYVHREVWKEIVAQRGAVLSVQLGDSDWKVGDRALLTHVYGGIGGAKGERASSGPVYFGHFAFGFAEVVLDELAQEPRFDLMFEQIYTQNVDGLIAGALHMSRYLGDRQFGWAGLRPTCNVLLKLDSFTGDFQIGGRRGGALDGFFTQLEAMTARYRIGDGTGCTYVGPANNCSQDSNRALFAALEGLEEFVDSPAFIQWKASNTPDAARFSRLVALGTALEKQLSPFGSARRDWSENQFNLGTTMSDDPLDQLKAGLGSWRVILPRLANDTIVKTFLKNGATARVITTNQLGARDGIAPVVPLTF
jgi:predicted Abi (CAAX) family protease